MSQDRDPIEDMMNTKSGMIIAQLRVCLVEGSQAKY